MRMPSRVKTRWRMIANVTDILTTCFMLTDRDSTSYAESMATTVRSSRTNQDENTQTFNV